MEKNKKKQEYYSYAPWEDNYESTADTDSGQDAFEEYLVDFSRSTPNLFLLFKLIYTGVIYSIMVYKSSMSSGDKFCEGPFCFMVIAAFIFLEDCAKRLKLKIDKSIYGAKTYIFMGIYAVFTLFYCFLRYAKLIDNNRLLEILIVVILSNEGLAIIDYLKPERKNRVKLSGFKYIWMISLPILLILQLYGNLPYKDAVTFILANFAAIIAIEVISIFCIITSYTRFW